jgi:hypothetical protein
LLDDGQREIENSPTRNEAGNSATSSALGEDYLLQTRNREFTYSENPIVHLIHEKMDAGCKEKRSKRNKDPSSCSSGTFALKGEQREACRHDNSILPRCPLHRGKSGIVPHLRRQSQPCLGKNLLSENLADEGTDAGMLGDIMKPENETRCSLYHEMRSRRWEKLLMNESSGKGGIPADVIVGRLKSKPSRRRDNTKRTLSSDET